MEKTDPIPIDTIEQPTVPEPKPLEEIKPPSEIQTEKLDFIKKNKTIIFLIIKP